MAIAGVRRLSSQICRNPSLSPISRSIMSRFSASSSGSAKVADRIVKIFAIDIDGRKREIVGLSGQTLLKALTNHGLIDPASHRLEEIEACSSECEVHIAQEWLQKLPPPTYDEQYVLRRNSRSRVLNKHARLGCQVTVTPELQGMVVSVPEPKPWDTPHIFFNLSPPYSIATGFHFSVGETSEVLNERTDLTVRSWKGFSKYNKVGLTEKKE